MKSEEHFEDILICDGTAKVEISPNGMTVTVLPLSDGFTLPPFRELCSILSEYGIVEDTFIAPVETDSGWIVARGIEPVAGEDGKVEIIAKEYCATSSVEQDESNDGYIDPKLRKIIINVRKGEKVAKRIPPGKGVPGRDVFGREIAASPGKWIAFHPGSGVEVLDEQYLASTVNGSLNLEGEMISVLEEMEIDGPVDMSTGHVNFCGKLLTVKGSVNTGFRVVVRGNLIVEGNIEDEVTIDVGGNLYVKGIVRAKKSVVKARGNIQCGAVEYAEVSAGRDLSVEEYMLDAICKAGGDVEVNRGKGLVAGGKIFLGGSFVGNIVGTPAYVPTMIHAGFNPHIKETHDQYVADLEDYAGKRDELSNALDKLDRLEEKRGGLSEKFINLRNEIKKGLANIDRSTAERKQEIEALEAQIGRLREAVVIVNQMAYPSATIRISNAVLTLKKMVNSVKFQFRKGQIVLTTL